MSEKIDKMFRLTEADWDTFRGNNHIFIPAPKITCGGGVSFKKHLGKPLSQHLWEDLIHRLEIDSLCVYNYNDAQWCLGWSRGHCNITLDKDNKVSDIYYVPYGR